MSYANGTQFYNLPQTVGTDKRDWFDTNSAFAAIDAALHAAAIGQAADAEAIATINASLATDEAAIAALQTASSSQAAQISTLQTVVNGQATQIADVRQDAEDMITANNEGAAATSTRAYAIDDYFIYNDVLYKATAAIAIGDTIVPNTNCEATNVDTEIKAVEASINDVKSELYGTIPWSITQAGGSGGATFDEATFFKISDKVYGFSFHGQATAHGSVNCELPINVAYKSSGGGYGLDYWYSAGNNTNGMVIGVAGSSGSIMASGIVIAN